MVCFFCRGQPGVSSFVLHLKFRHDTLTVQCLLPKKSWDLLMKIGHLVAQSLGLSADEADYLMNFDIKYRMGQGAEDEDD